MRIVTASVERSATRAARCEMDLSGGTESSPRRARAGSMRVAAGAVLSTGPASGVFEDVQLLVGEFAVSALREVTQFYRANAYSLQRE